GFYFQMPPKRITTGTFALGGAGANAFHGTVIINGESFDAVSGQLKIDVSGTRAVIGSFTMTAQRGTETVQATGSFSAACTTPVVTACQPTEPAESVKARSCVNLS
ncbi:MAG: hypothetical protein ABI852_11725, partial [Gemmatimonadaceae bacterium]